MADETLTVFKAGRAVLCAPSKTCGAQRTARPTRLGQVLLVLVLTLMVGTAGCHKPQGTVLGKAPKGDSTTVLAIRAGDTPPQVTLSGVMVEKCPVAGCWLKVQDATGTMMVDTKAAGFVVVNVPLESKITVAGKIVTEGDEVFLEASGLRY
jgi:uncharacterized protein YdeI (BOF family)